MPAPLEGESGMRAIYVIATLAAVLLVPALARCQPPVPGATAGGTGEAPKALPPGVLAQFDLENEADVQGWAPLVEGTTLSITHEPANVRQGQGALQFDYTPVEDYYLFQRGGLQVPGAKSLSFSVKATEKTPLLYGLGEGDGSAYDAFLELPANKWVDVQANLADLQLRPGSVDENNQLDADQLATVVFFDLCNMPGEDGRALGWKKGPQKLWLDNVIIGTQEVPSVFRTEDLPNGKRRIVVADFESQVVRGLDVGGAVLDLVPADRGQALKITYRVGPERWSGVVLGLGSLDLRGLEQVKVRLKSAAKAAVNLVLEERGDKSHYERLLDLEGNGAWHSYEVPVAEFTLSETSEDENGQLDPGELRVVIVVVDTYNAVVDAQGQGAVTADDIELICGPAPGATQERTLAPETK